MFAKKSFLNYPLFVMIFMACTPSSPQPNATDSASLNSAEHPSSSENTPNSEGGNVLNESDNSLDFDDKKPVLRIVGENDEMPTWSDDIAETYIFKKDPRYQLIIDAANAMHNRYFDARIRYDSIYGNLIFVNLYYEEQLRVDAAPLPDKMVAVILGSDTMRLVDLPDKELFAHFASVVRRNPKMLPREYRISIAVFLTTGYDNNILDNISEDYEYDKGERRAKFVPTWKESSGKLTIRYHSLIGRNALSTDPVKRQQCTIIVDADQNFTQKCDKPVPL
ncbi:MAG: hypothetical protein FWC40_03665 [Proteobacteria bacterium]|nr:hypothetical protein [Pseudomonadota bacterium]